MAIHGHGVSKFCITLFFISRTLFLVSVEFSGTIWRHRASGIAFAKTVMTTFALSSLLVAVIALSGVTEAKLVKVGDLKTIFHDVKGSVYIKVGWEVA